jgi:hypothetical protein
MHIAQNAPSRRLIDMDMKQLNEELEGIKVYPRSVVEADNVTYFLARRAQVTQSPSHQVLGVVGDITGFDGERQGDVLLCPLTPDNAAALRGKLPWLRPVSLSTQTSAGCGDRLGLATPGHVRAARQFTGIAPIFAQQSVRENTRTGRTPQQVMDDAMWGLFQEGWRESWGADADHLKTPDDVDEFAAAGFTFYTIDPGDHVDNSAHTASSNTVADKVQALPWGALEDTARDMEQRYLDRAISVEAFPMTLTRDVVYRAAAKYGRAIAHTTRMYRHLVERMGDTPFELEVSVDETETPTSPEEHLFIASELQRLGVEWVSLAPRYIGRFEKGVDYIGDLDVFEAELAQHAAIARAFGPYKLSIHSGSDKFTIYPIITRLTGGLVHVKTAGTSYLEALRAVGQVDPPFFRQILALARERYETDRATYHVSAQLGKVPALDALDDADLPDLLEQFDARQVLHVTFGSVLDQFGERLLATLQQHEEVYYGMLETHFQRHLAPFAA